MLEQKGLLRSYMCICAVRGLRHYHEKSVAYELSECSSADVELQSQATWQIRHGGRCSDFVRTGMRSLSAEGDDERRHVCIEGLPDVQTLLPFTAATVRRR